MNENGFDLSTEPKRRKRLPITQSIVREMTNRPQKVFSGKNAPAFDVIGIGACAVDFLGIVSEFPRPDTKSQMRRLIRQGGGPAATALVALSRLGASVSYLGKLGSDELSRFALDDFIKEGVDVSHVIKEEGTGPHFAFVVADEKSGQRTIWWTDEQVCEVKPDEINRECITSAKFLLVDEYQFEAALEAARLAKPGKVQVVLDAERPNRQGIEKIIQLTDILIVPEEFASGFSRSNELESSAQSLLNLGPSVVIITQGKEGSFCKTANSSFHQSAFQVEVVDTTGCGDVFHGAFIYGMLQGWPLKAVAEFASAVSALKCRKLGGRSGIPNLKEVRKFLFERGSSEIKGIIRG